MPDEKVKQAFLTALDLPAAADVEALELGTNSEWDSVAHMALVAELEEQFSISLDAEDIVDLSSYAKSLEILRRYDVAV